MFQGVQQVPHPRGRDRQRPAARGLRPQIELQLPGRDPLGTTLALLLRHLPTKRHQHLLDLRAAFSQASLTDTTTTPRCLNWRMILSAPSAPSRVIRSSAHTTSTENFPACASSKAFFRAEFVKSSETSGHLRAL